MADVYGDVRMYPLDQELWHEIPTLHEKFQHQMAGRSSRSDDWIELLAQKLANNLETLKSIQQWLTFCTAVKLPPNETCVLFVQVLWCRFQGLEDEAARLLNLAQVNTVRVSMLLPCCMETFP